MAAKRRRTVKGDRGLHAGEVRDLLLALDGIEEGKSYGYPSFLLRGRFFARFRDGDTVLVLQVGTIDDRDFLIGADPAAFFFTEHYRNYPAVLIRLAEISSGMLAEVLRDAWQDLSARPARPRRRR